MIPDARGPARRALRLLMGTSTRPLSQIRIGQLPPFYERHRSSRGFAEVAQGVAGYPSDARARWGGCIERWGCAMIPPCWPIRSAAAPRWDFGAGGRCVCAGARQGEFGSPRWISTPPTTHPPAPILRNAKEQHFQATGADKDSAPRQFHRDIYVRISVLLHPRLKMGRRMRRLSAARARSDAASWAWNF